MDQKMEFTKEESDSLDKIEAATWARQRRWLAELGIIVLVVGSAIYALSGGL